MSKSDVFHLGLTKNDLQGATLAIVPGDPERVEKIAALMDKPVKLASHREFTSWRAELDGKPVIVCSTGIGGPSTSIAVEELAQLGVRTFLRIGTTGAIQPHINLKDIVMAMGASTDSNWANQFHLAGTFAPICSYKMLRAAIESAEELDAPYHVGNILSSDVFYGDDENVPEALDPNHNWRKMGIMAIEMESAALYLNAARYGKNALCICTVSDQLVRGEFLSADERQTGFRQMMQVALETAVKLEK